MCVKAIVLVSEYNTFPCKSDAKVWALEDGHHKTIVEHTLNILFLPGIHDKDSSQPQAIRAESSTDISVSTASTASILQTHHPAEPQLSVPGTSISFPSPFHIQLHIVTSLSFNEQGRITHHRDIWDVKDVLGLVPGLTLAQWIGTRLAAHSLGFAARLLIGGSKKVIQRIPSMPSFFGVHSRNASTDGGASGYVMMRGSGDVESQRQEKWDGSKVGSNGGSGAAPLQPTPAAAYGAYAKHVLGLDEGGVP